MANEQDNKPTTDEQSDISKSQAAQQPTGEQGQQAEFGEQRQPAELDQDSASDNPDEGSQGDTLAQQRTDVEGSSQSGTGGSQSDSGFVGSQGQQDSSSELIDDEDENKDTPEGE